MNEDTNKYECLILSHVLEHIYDVNAFLQKIDKNVKPDGLLYIEVPNAEFYDKINDITPLQEINIEHINFFSKYSLNKLLINHGYYAVSLKDDYFKIKENNYYVIRGVFIKSKINLALPSYITRGNEIINTFNYSKLNEYEQIYIYGCGQFLFKTLSNIQKCTKVINIIDDNLCYYNKIINGVSIINFEKYREKTKKSDIILLTTLIYDEIIRNKIKSIDNINVNVISINEL
jgi:FlaA1/EpsC-like NDP-sugar epimerase